MRDVREYEPFFGNWKVCANLEKTGNGGRYIIKNKNTGEFSVLNHISIPRDENYINAAKRWVPQDGDIEEFFDKQKDMVLEEIKFGISLSKCKNIFGTYECDVRKREMEIGWDIFLRLEDPKRVTSYDTPNDVIKMGIDICNALDFCEKNNIRHGNIAPDAIFLSDDGNYKLGRFKLYTAGMNVNKVYAAPEVINKEESDIRADLYSLGIVMYQFLNGNALPFVMPGEKNEVVIRQATMDRLKGRRMPAPSQAEGALARMIMKACRLEIEERYETPVKFRDDLLTVWEEPKAADPEEGLDEAEALALKMLAELGEEKKPAEGKKEEPTVSVNTTFGENVPESKSGMKSFINPFNPSAGIVYEKDEQDASEETEQRAEASKSNFESADLADIENEVLRAQSETIDIEEIAAEETIKPRESVEPKNEESKESSSSFGSIDIDEIDEDKLLSEIGEMLKMEGLTDL